MQEGEERPEIAASNLRVMIEQENQEGERGAKA